MRFLTDRLLSSSDRRVARQTFWLGTSSGVTLLGGIVQVAITARMLGVEGYGALAAITAFCALVHGLVAIPSGDMVTTFVTRSVTEGRKEEAARIVRFGIALSLGMSLIGYAAIVALTLAATELLGITDNTTYKNAALLYGMAGILSAPASDSQAILRLADRVSLASVVSLVSTLARVGLIAAAWYMDGGLIGVILAHVAATALSSAGMLLVAALSARRAGIDGLLRSVSVTVPPDVLRFQFGSFGNSALGSASGNLDTILVAQLAGTADAGIYRAARQIVDYARQPFKQMSIAIKVEFSRMWYANDIAGVRVMLLRFVLVSVALALVGFGLLAYFREYAIAVIFGDDFAAVAAPLLIMIVGSLVASCVSPMTSLPIAAGRISPSLVFLGSRIVASTAAILWLVPLYGADGAAWANTIAILVSSVILAPFIISIIRGRHTRYSDSPSSDQDSTTHQISSGEFVHS